MIDGSANEQIASPVVVSLTAIAQAGGKKVLPRNQLGAWHSMQDSEVAVLSYAHDFPYLWGLSVEDGDEFGLKGIAEHLVRSINNGEYTFVIIWDDIPRGETDSVDTARYLTPIDWAVALSLSVAKIVSEESSGESSEIYPDLRIFILDLASENVSNASSVLFVREHPRRDVMSMPWIRLLRPAIDGGTEWDAENLVSSLFSRRGVTPNTVSTMRTGFSTVGPGLDIARRLWAAFLTKPAEADDHHALANLIGPLILLGDSSQDDNNVRALRCLMQAVGLLPDIGPRAGGMSAAGADSILRDGSPWIELDDVRPGKLKVLLVDDQWRDGWGEVVCKALGVEYAPVEDTTTPFLRIGIADSKVEIKATASVNWLVDKLGAFEPSDQRFSLTLDDKSSAPLAQEILLLDLRLFSGKSIKYEAEYIKKLLNIAKRFPDSLHPQELPWPGFSQKEIEDIDAWADEAIKSGAPNLRNDSRYHQALSLLPRILALTDLSYPIILFSSTGRREIIASLQRISTILTTFEKPRLDAAAQPGDVIERARLGFTRAFDQARRLCDGRAFVHQLAIIAKEIAPGTVCSPRKDGVGKKSKIYAELYLDESGSEFDDKKGTLHPVWDKEKPMVVGGVLAVFGGRKQAKRFNALLGRIPAVKDALGNALGGKRALRNAIESILEETAKQAMRMGVDVSFVGLKGATEDAVYAGPEQYQTIESELIADNLWREMMACVIELSIYHGLRSRYPDCNDIEYQIYLPTRTFELTDRNTLDARHLFQNWGIRKYKPEVGKKRISLVSSDAARPLVQRIAAHYRGANYRPRATAARAFPLNGFGSSSINDCKVLHLVADEVVGHESKHPYFQNGFAGQYGGSLQTLLRAYRLMINGFAGEGLAVATGITAEELHATDNRDVARGLCRSLHDIANHMNGRDWHAFIDQMEGLTNAPDDARIEGRITQVKPRGVIILLANDGYTYKATTCGPKRTIRLVIGDEIRFVPKRHPLFDDHRATKLEFINRSEIWDGLNKGDSVLATVGATRGDEYWVTVENIGGRLKGARSYKRGETVNARVVECDKSEGELHLVESEKADTQE